MASVRTLLTALMSFDMLCLSMSFVVYGQHVLAAGGTELFIGVLNSIAAAISLIWNPILGSIGDTKGRKYTLIVSLAVCALSHLLMAISTTTHIIFISRIVAGFGGLTKSLMRTLITDLLPTIEQASFLSSLNLYAAGTFIGGSLIAGYISERGGTNWVFGMVTLIAVINIGITSLLPDIQVKLKQKKQATTSYKDSLFEGFSTITSNLKNISWTKYWDMFLSKLLSEFTFGFIQTNMGFVLLKKYDVKGASLGYLFTLVSVINIGANIGFTKVRTHFYTRDKYGYMQIFHISVIVFITTIGLGYSNSLPSFLFSIGPILALSTIVDNVFLQSLGAKDLGLEKGRVCGALESVTSLSALLIPLISGVASELFDNQTTLKLAILPAFAYALLSFKQNRSNQ